MIYVMNVARIRKNDKMEITDHGSSYVAHKDRRMKEKLKRRKIKTLEKETIKKVDNKEITMKKTI